MADTTPPAGLLRPLGFGELFDRAVTLYVRNFLAFSGIVLVPLLPLGIVLYFIDAGQTGQMSAILDAMRGKHPLDPITAQVSSSYYGWLALLIFLTLLLVPFALNAVALGVARLYMGFPVDARACYVAALRRFWPTIGLIVMWIVILSSAYGALVVLVAIFVGIGIAILSSVQAAAIVMIAIGALLGIAMVGVMVQLGMAMNFAMYSLVIENRGVFDSIGAGFSRIFSRAEFWRSMLFAFCAGLIYFAGALAAGGFGLIALVLHWPVLTVLVETVTRTVLYAFGVVLFAVYYYDVRIRREGLDVEAGLQSLVAPATA